MARVGGKVEVFHPHPERERTEVEGASQETGNQEVGLKGFPVGAL